MADKKNRPVQAEHPKVLRDRAERQILEKISQLPENLHTLLPDQARLLLHELRVHQVELELQNEELRSAQEQLQASRAAYFDLYDQAPVGYLTLDENGLILTANFTAAKMFSAESRPFIGLPLTRFILPEDQDIFYLHRKQVEKGSPKNCELRMLHTAGSPFWVRLASSFGSCAEGAPLCRITVSDITESRLAQEKVEQAAREWQKTFDSMNDVVWMLDKDSRITRANQATERVFGRSAGEVLGLHCYEIAHADKKPVNGCPLKTARKSMRREKMELQMGDKTFEVIVDPIADSAGRFNGAVHILADITERKKMEAEKERLIAELEGKRKEVEDFIYITTHDLRTPLVCIQGFSENLRKDLAQLADLTAPEVLPEEIKRKVVKLTGSSIPEALTAVTEGAVKIHHLLNALLKVSRMGQLEMFPEILDAESVLGGVLVAMAYQLRTEEAEVKVGELPPCQADPAALSHIFTNLLDNALKYRDKSRKLKISVQGEKKGGVVLYSITDNGLGIKAADLPKIWNIFYCGNIPGVKKGEGIGLSMVRRLVEKSRGKIWAESKEGSGSTFFLELPA